ncbi:Crp/FNR family transcriptional regulator [Caballeronia terrestris]|uniref:Crp/FNR family transcriptional regulator n=1 Tax=Caballeronia terrestris TaxID=1226301 RepID=A0A158KNG1_9BURK|nr:helix-turn-helix domain-containing protein [Caballeronia terrestris]SAL82686.1 Crp/FNR family transcriptional regulator [Caballeronia terrestris]
MPTLKPASSPGCGDCRARPVCLARDLGPRELARLDAIIQARRTVKRGESLYRANDPFDNIYAVHVGSFKTLIAHGDGVEQVTGFHLSGEPLGLDGICTERHNCTAIALEDSTVCIIPFPLLESLCREVSAMQHQVHRMMSGEIVRGSRLMMVLAAMSAERRLAVFLVNLSERLKVRGYSPAELSLRMSREEMGSLLGMKLETVSRMFSKFQQQRLINVQGKQVQILDFGGLSRIERGCTSLPIAAATG